MSKGEETKAKILQQAAELFNQQGYAGSSISDIMRVTGLQKGGIYNHFSSKDELALQAFDYAIAQIKKLYRDAWRSKHHAIERLQAIMGVFHRYINHSPIKGGCPLLNTAIESDDTHPALRKRAQQAMDSWRELICLIIEKGIERGEVRPTVNADEFATIMIAMLEGAVMMSKLYGDEIHLDRAIKHLNDYMNDNLQT
ncbi:MAG: TetR/AcrR family transcriptional regulator [Pelatocladus maniniholoensis HA4357-MV3]|jgi:TetR/AcrR family transcriptional repressor of nem operon|uniref:TetR/AcrR family transcriptional regulator n=1 Tax=Pelatocladus maniniholoensis HA4357-MV3 TaxID=1117104 RepID=A0A9E3H5W0_9NOST|nr:TetR/AcrR family transcriptional regulator [Pelatocladus maniniholoensis HA4357-MV3]BAZ69613.1 TetR family transcriptional regulator [Fischerella sp. NIES-4106]